MLNAERHLPFNSIGVRVLTASNDPNELTAARIGSVFLCSNTCPNPSLYVKTGETWTLAVPGGQDSSSLVAVMPRDVWPFVNSFRLGND
jgi:hypothetical protein